MKRLILLMLLYPAMAVAQTSISLNESTTYTAGQQGINLNTETSYDSHLEKNVWGAKNPSLQSLLNVYLLNVGSVTTATTTVVDYDTFSNIFANQYQGGTYVVLCSAGNNFTTVQVCNGSGSSGGCSGTITSNTANSGSGATFVLSTCANGFTHFDSIAIYGPQTASTAVTNFGWNSATTGTGTVTIDTTGGNLYSGAVQAVKLCNGSSGTASISVITDDLSGSTYNMIPINGTYTDSIMTNILSGSGMTITASVVRGGGINTSTTLSPTGSGWQTTSGIITGSESATGTRNSMTGTYTLNLTAPNSCVDVINAQLTNNADNNASLFNNATIANLGSTVLNAGECRFSWPVNFDTLTNMLAVQAVRAGTNPAGGINSANASLGLHDSLTACKVAGVPNFWLSVPMTFQQADFVNLVNYLAGTSGTYASLRATLGQSAAWTTVFKNITIEIGNEEWNTGSQNSIPGYSGCGTYGCWNYFPLAINDCGYLKTATGWNSSLMKCSAGIRQGDGSSAHNMNVQDTNSYVDFIAVAQYTQGQQSNSCTTQGLYTPAVVEAWADATDASNDPGQYHYVSSQGYNYSTYEGQKNPSGGNTCTNTQLIGFAEGEGFALATSSYALQMNKAFSGMVHWDFFDIYGYTQSPEALWGIFSTGAQPWNPHPAAYAMGMINTCMLLGTGYSATPSSPPTLNFSASNGVLAYSAFPLVQSFAFKNGSTSRCAVVYNYDYSASHAITFTGTNAPSSATYTLLTSTNTTDSNETSLAVQPSTGTTSFPYTIPAHSMVTFQFTTGSSAANTPTFSPVAGSYGPTQNVTISTTSSGAIICYNTTGSPATNGTTGCTTGTLYTTPVSVASSETLYAVAGGTGYTDSSVGSAAYTINGAASTPTFSPVAGTYTGSQSVTISTSTGPVICYTTNGTTPATNGTSGCTTGILYTTAVTVSSSETLKAIAGGTGYSDGSVGSAAYTIKATTPTFSPVAGTYTGTQNVTISTTLGSVICYNTTGSPATNGTTGCTTGTLYSGPVVVSSSETLYAVAGGTGISDGTVGSAAYTINPASAPLITIIGNVKGSGKVVYIP